MLIQVIDDFLDAFPTDVLSARALALNSSSLTITKKNNSDLFNKIHSTQMDFILYGLKEKITERYEVNVSMNFLFTDRKYEKTWSIPEQKENEYNFKGMIFLNPEFFNNEENYGVTINKSDEDYTFVVPNKFNRYVIFEASNYPYCVTNGFGDGKEFSRLTLEHEINIKFYK